MPSPDLCDKAIHPLLHLLRTLPTGMFFARRTPIGPDPPILLLLLDLLGDESFVGAVIPFGDLFGRLEWDGGGYFRVIVEELGKMGTQVG
jgi:hypothetical protein